jgi:citronellol/citronellal dehydrogenase
VSQVKDFGMSDEQLASAKTIYAPDLFAGKRVVISGGGSGIGKAAAWLFARLGARVHILGRKLEKLNAVATEMSRHALPVEVHQINIRESEEVEQFFNDDKWREAPVDFLVNSAGGQFPQESIDFSANGWKSVVDTNLNGTWFMMQAAARHWIAAGVPGNIINLVTVIDRGMPGVAHTCAARAGVIYASKSVAVEWAPYDIRVNCVAPGITDTEGMNVYPEEAVKHFTESNPMRRFASAWEIAEAVAYLASDASAFITGEVLALDGGGKLWGELWTAGKPDYFKTP